MLKKFLLVLFFIFISNAAYSFDVETPIRVGISDTKFSTYIFTSSEFYATESYDVTDTATGEKVSFNPNEFVKITITDGKFSVYKNNKLKFNGTRGPVVIKTQNSALIGVKDLKRAGKPALYRGIIELTPVSSKSNGFAIVNVLDLQNYLKGVVPNEMPVYFGLEALKAQCIAARNYALRPRSTYYKEFDICDSVSCQVYFGAKTEKALSNKAVEQTDGLVALYDNDLILAVYSSTAGGYTESHANAFSDPNSKKFPGPDIPYLQAVPDIPDMKSLSDEKDAREFYSTEPDTFDNNSPYFRWTREWTLSEFITMLNQTMKEQRAFIKPDFTDYDKFSVLKEINIKQRGNSGKVMFIQIFTENGEYTIGKELTIRRLFKKDGKALPSANFVCDVIKDDFGQTKVRFTGGGFGHGVGLSQYGAGKMAQAGLSFIDILQHYYTGISIGTKPVTIWSQYGKNSAVLSFFAPKGKAGLIIDDIKGINEVTLIINGIETDVNLGKFFKKDKVSLDKYIRTGNNSLEVDIPDDYNTQKYLKMHVEVAGAR